MGEAAAILQAMGSGWGSGQGYCRQWEVGGALDKATAGSRNWVGLWTRLLQAMEVGGALDKASYCRQQKLGGALDMSYTMTNETYLPAHLWYIYDMNSQQLAGKFLI